jgi:alpha-aminoadipic semialdehyde synthase
VKTTDSGRPSYVVQPLTREVRDGYTGEGIVVLAVDNLPAEIPNDSSTFFSKQLSPFLPSLLEADFAKPLEHSGLCPELQRAVIVYKGQLTPSYSYLEKFIDQNF